MFGECEAIFAAFMDLVSLQHDHDFGNFSRTGASNTSNHWRHRHMTSKVSIHDDTRHSKRNEKHRCWTN